MRFVYSEKSTSTRPRPFLPIPMYLHNDRIFAIQSMLHHLTHITARVNDDEVAKSPAISDDDAARKKKSP